MTRRVIAIALFVSAAATPVAAQDRAHWGVAGTLIPKWEFLDFLEDSMDRSIEMRGDDMRIGIIRGRELGGEWGVAYIRRRVEDDSASLQETPKCVARTGQSDLCAAGTSFRTRSTFLNGVLLHRFLPFGTIARRVQIGIVASGGFAVIRGTAEETQEHFQVNVNNANGVATLGVATETRTVASQRVFAPMLVKDYLPIGGLEAAVSVTVAPGLNVRFSSGANFPGFHSVAFSAQYLFK